MLQVRAYVGASDVDEVAGMLHALDGVSHVTRAGRSEDGDQLLTADVTPDAAEVALRELRSRLAADRISLIRLEAVESASSRGPGVWLGRDPSVASWPEVLEEARGNARLFARYLALMAAAGVIAGVGVDSRNSILIIGAMAISPDLLPLSAACVAIVSRRPWLLVRSVATLAVGLLTVAVLASFTAFLHARSSPECSRSSAMTDVLTS